MRWLVTFACAGGAVLVAACGSSSSSPGGASSGTVQGQSLVVRDATFSDDMGGGGTTLFNRVTIYLTDGPRACTPTASSTQLVLYVQTTSRIDPGTYSLAPPDPDAGFAATDTIARAVVQSFDAQCMSRITTDSELATGGTITLETIEGGKVSGAFDAVFAGGELKGSFDARAYACGSGTETPPPNACP